MATQDGEKDNSNGKNFYITRISGVKKIRRKKVPI